MSTLRQGSKGKEVVKLQLLLNRYLKPSPKLKADGHFGLRTEQALVRFQAEHKLETDGIAGKKTWNALGTQPKATKPTEVATVNAPWYDIAYAELGIKEESEANTHNKRILEYHATTRLGAKTDETPWCSSFVNWVMLQSGIQGTNNALAKSWITWGFKVETPFKGAITVIKRKNKNLDTYTGSSTGYHVGFFVSATQSGIRLLGGNQSDQVKSSNFLLRSYEVVAYRRPFQTRLGYPLPYSINNYSHYC
ncbi:peptidoglycan binding protein [Oleiphilus messinensis]|uniref:Peptidoglycan binding protein n=1 Tax=Oleiphilus messinensis TaxID=141451 RepID=A0A1Y0I538_9GAMM|nr:TIGR02594 family protein [Oleiphilus messinensis]ARU55597.1 peptidoglycan binding protein [Oleiphilus messinensis]